MNLKSRHWLAALAATLMVSTAHAQTVVPYYVLTHYDVSPVGQTAPAGDTALAILGKYATAAAAETGATSVKVLPDAGRASRIEVIEVWTSQAAYAAHLTAASTTQLKSAIAAWLVGPADQRTHILFK